MTAGMTVVMGWCTGGDGPSDDKDEGDEGVVDGEIDTKEVSRSGRHFLINGPFWRVVEGGKVESGEEAERLRLSDVGDRGVVPLWTVL